MGFNFFKKAEGVTKDVVDNGTEKSEVDVDGKKELTGVEKNILRLAKNEKIMLANELGDILEAGGKDATSEEEDGGGEKEKKNKTWIKKTGEALVVVFCLGTIAAGAIGCGHADTRYIIKQGQRELFGDTLKNIDRKAESESNAMLSVEKDEARKIRKSDKDVHSKKASIHDAYIRKSGVN
jgi:hypothetical protein